MLDSLDTLIAFVTIMLVVSMLITIAVQLLTAAFNLRGSNLAKGLTNTLNTIMPGFEDQCEKFAQGVLSGPLLSDSRRRHIATAARPDEVFDAIHRIATGRRNDVPELRDDARRLLRGLGLSEAFLNDAEAQLAAATATVQGATGTVQGLKDAAAKTIEQLPENQRATVQQALAEVTSKLATAEAAADQQARQTAAAVTQAVDAAYKKFKYWYEVGQERAQQWFTTHTRWFTIGFAIVFAFWFQLDTVEIFKLVSSNRAVRDSLVAQAGVVTKQAEEILVDSPSVLEQALKDWRTGLTDDKARQAVPEDLAADAKSRGSLRDKVREKLTGAQVPEIDSLLAGLDQTIDKTAQKNLEESARQFSKVKLDLDQTGFTLIPIGKWRWGNTWCDGFRNHYLGMIFSAALLSLGAPFWFNALKSLANLRSKVAENISTEQKGEKLPPGAAPPAAKVAAPVPSAPPTVR